jgi:hypothetical protein
VTSSVFLRDLRVRSWCCRFLLICLVFASLAPKVSTGGSSRWVNFFQNMHSRLRESFILAGLWKALLLPHAGISGNPFHNQPPFSLERRIFYRRSNFLQLTDSILKPDVSRATDEV